MNNSIADLAFGFSDLLRVGNGFGQAIYSQDENGYGRAALVWPKSIYRVYIKRAADRIGLRKRIGWHTFRHTFGTILNANGENPKVIQELMRHANLKVTMDTYVQAVTDEKREAQNKLLKMILPGIQRAVI